MEPPSVDDGTNICPLTTEQMLARLRNESLVFPTWTVPSYRSEIFCHTHVYILNHQHIMLQTCVLGFRSTLLHVLRKLAIVKSFCIYQYNADCMEV